jgi:hypothetical protein
MASHAIRCCMSKYKRSDYGRKDSGEMVVGGSMKVGRRIDCPNEPNLKELPLAREHFP